VLRQSRGDDKNLRVVGVSRKRHVVLRFFNTLKSRRSDGGFAFQRNVEAQERRLRGSMEPRSEDESLGEG
jgi:hypothetical protein